MPDKTITTLELLIQGNTARIDADISKLNAKMRGLESSGKNAGRGISSGFSSALPDLSKFGLAAGAAGIAIGGLSNGIKEMLAKENQLADLSAITGIVGNDLNALADSATNLSDRFGTSVTDNIESFKGVVGRLGPAFGQSTEAMDKMANNINVLSKASGLSATEAMNALTTSLLQFDISLDDPIQAAGVATDMMNIMAEASVQGAAEIPQLSSALEQVGSTAKSLGISFEETVASIEILAQKGKFGSEAGIALRNVLVSLTKPSQEAADKLKEIGFSADEFNSILTTRGAGAAFAELQKNISKIPDPAEQASIKVMLFGKENLTAANAMLGSTDALDKMTNSLGGTSTAFDQADLKMQTSTEKWNRFTSFLENKVVLVLEGVKGKIGSVFSDIEKFFDGTTIKNFFGQLTGQGLVADIEKMSANQIKAAKQAGLEYQKIFEQRDFAAKLMGTTDEDAQWLQKRTLELKQKFDAETAQAKKNVLSAVLDDETKQIKEKTDIVEKTFDSMFGNLSKATLSQLETAKEELTDKLKTLVPSSSDARSIKKRIDQISDIINPKKAKSVKKEEKPDSIGLKEVEEAGNRIRQQMTDIINEESSAWIDAQGKLQNLEFFVNADDLDTQAKSIFDQYNKLFNDLEQLRNEDVISEQKYNEIKAALAQKSAEEVADIQKKGEKDKQKQWEKENEIMIEAYSAGNAALTGLMSAAISSSADAWKEGVKPLLMALLDFAEKKLILGEAVSLIEALFNPTALIKNIPLLIASELAINIARAAIASFDVGSWNVPRTQVALVHAGEMIIPARQAEQVRSGNSTIGVSVSSKRTKVQKLSGNITVNYDSFSNGFKQQEFKIKSSVI